MKQTLQFGRFAGQDTNFVLEFHRGSTNIFIFFSFVASNLKTEVAQTLHNLRFGNSLGTKQ